MLHIALIALLAGSALAQQPGPARFRASSRGPGPASRFPKRPWKSAATTAATPPLHTTTTESDGRFLIPNVRPGRYRVVVSRPGYVRRTLSVTVVARTDRRACRRSLTATAAISGRVYGTNGEPLGNIDVAALKPSYQDGRRILTAVQTVRTDDRGEYRLFWLPPGKYYVSATHPDAKSPMERMMDVVGAAPFRAAASARVSARSDRPAIRPRPAHRSSQLERRGAARGTVRADLFPGTIGEQAASADRSQRRRGRRRRGHSAGAGSRAPRPRRRDQRRNGTGRPVRRVEGGPEDVAGRDARRDSRTTPRSIRTARSTCCCFQGPHTLMGTAGTGVGFVTIEVARCRPGGDPDCRDAVVQHCRPDRRRRPGQQRGRREHPHQPAPRRPASGPRRIAVSIQR